MSDFDITFISWQIRANTGEVTRKMLAVDVFLAPDFFFSFSPDFPHTKHRYVTQHAETGPFAKHAAKKKSQKNLRDGQKKSESEGGMVGMHSRGENKLIWGDKGVERAWVLLCKRLFL